MILGAHCSTAGGLWKAAERGGEMGCDAIQIFTRAPQRWAGKAITDEDAQKFRDACKERNLKPVAHDIYLTNLAAADSTIRDRSIVSFKDEVHRCSQLGIPYLVTHCGAHPESIETGIGLVVEALREVIDDCPQDVTVLLEGTAGQGNALGSTFEQLAEMLAKTDRPNNTAVCLDTCHLFAAGYDLRTPEAFSGTMEEFDRVVGLKHLRVMHANDAKKDLGSHVDRHADIGEGLLGLETFRLLVNDARLAEVPILLETPGYENYAGQLETLRGLIEV